MDSHTHGRKARRMVSSIGIIVILSYAGLCLLLFSCQTPIIFPRGGSIWQTPGDAGFEYEDIHLDVFDKATHGWYIHADAPRGVVLFSHGNAGTIADRLDSVAIFREMGFDVLIYDYGGYGLSTGRPSENRCNADVAAVWHYLTVGRDVDPGKIVLFGRSLGTGPTVELASRELPAAVILESPLLSVVRVAKGLYPFLPVNLLARHRFDNEAKINKVRAPLLILHSPSDEIIPFSHGQRLFELANEPKQFVELRGTHNDGYVATGERYVETINRFLTPYVPRESVLAPPSLPGNDE